jgi:4-diphosphocytidyl-2-C-methyl-D-erythritol kinase
MHRIEAEMVTLDLADRLDVIDAPSGAVSQVIDDEGRPRPDDDLIHQALALAGRSAQVTLTKAIPPGAGLGGGSGDAATVLRWAGFTDTVAAVGIGADVAFCLVGGRARVSGIGDVIEPLPFEDRMFTLLMAPFGCSTPAVYQAWDQMGAPRGDHGNDLEPAALRVAPELETYRDQLAALAGQRPRLAGSGSTWFVEGAFKGDGVVVVRTVPEQWTGPAELL